MRQNTFVSAVLESLGIRMILGSSISNRDGVTVLEQFGRPLREAATAGVEMVVIAVDDYNHHYVVDNLCDIERVDNTPTAKLAYVAIVPRSVWEEYRHNLNVLQVS